MLAILSLVQQLLSVGAGTKRSQISGINLNATSIAAFMIAMATTVVSVVLLMMALQSWLAVVIASPYAVSLSWLCCALVTLAFAGISILVSKGAKEHHGLISLAYATQPKAHAHHEYGTANGANHHVNGEEHKSPFDETFIKNITEEVAAKIEDHPLTSVVLAGLAGMAAGKSMER